MTLSFFTTATLMRERILPRLSLTHTMHNNMLLHFLSLSHTLTHTHTHSHTHFLPIHTQTHTHTHIYTDMLRNKHAYQRQLHKILHSHIRRLSYSLSHTHTHTQHADRSRTSIFFN